MMPASSVIQKFWPISVTSDPVENFSLVDTGCLLIAFVNISNLKTKG